MLVNVDFIVLLSGDSLVDSLPNPCRAALVPTLVKGARREPRLAVKRPPTLNLAAVVIIEDVRIVVTVIRMALSDSLIIHIDHPPITLTVDSCGLGVSN